MCSAGETDVNGPEAAKTLADLLDIPHNQIVVLAGDYDHVLLPHGLVSPHTVLLCEDLSGL
jgi:hypothetical protein